MSAELSSSTGNFLVIAGGCVLLGTVITLYQIYRCIAAAFYNPEAAEEARKKRDQSSRRKKTSTKKKPAKRPKAAAKDESSSEEDEAAKPSKPAGKPGVSLKALQKSAQARKKAPEGPDKLAGHKLFLNALKGHTETVHSIAWRSDSDALATACDDRFVRVFNFNGDITSNPRQQKFQHRWFPVGVAYGAEKHSLAVVTHVLLDVANFEIYNTDKFQDGPTIKTEGIHGKDSIIGIASSLRSRGGGPLVVTCTRKKTLKLLDFGGRELAAPAPNAFDNYMATISMDGRFIAAGTFTSDVKIWEAEFSREGTFTGCPKAMQLGHKGATLAVAFSPDSTRVVTASRDGFLRVWRIDVRYKQQEDAKCLLQAKMPLQKAQGCYTALAWSPCGKAIAAVAGGDVHFLEPSNGELREAVRGLHDTSITALAWSPTKVDTPDGSCHVLAVASANRVRIIAMPQS